MQTVLWVLAALVLVVLLLMAWVRLAPSSPTVWHVDPTMVDPPEEGGWLARPSDGNSETRTYPTDPVSLLGAFNAVALAEPRTRRLAGSPEEGRITYVCRSRIMGFPDYVTVQAIPRKGGTSLAVYSRLRFGRGDMGVNRERVERWLRELGARLGAQGSA